MRKNLCATAMSGQMHKEYTRAMRADGRGIDYAQVKEVQDGIAAGRLPPAPREAPPGTDDLAGVAR